MPTPMSTERGNIISTRLCRSCARSLSASVGMGWSAVTRGTSVLRPTGAIMRVVDGGDAPCQPLGAFRC